VPGKRAAGGQASAGGKPAVVKGALAKLQETGEAPLLEENPLESYVRTCRRIHTQPRLPAFSQPGGIGRVHAWRKRPTPKVAQP
jgi:hypothetical protein